MRLLLLLLDEAFASQTLHELLEEVKKLGIHFNALPVEVFAFGLVHGFEDFGIILVLEVEIVALRFSQMFEVDKYVWMLNGRLFGCSASLV